MRQVTFRGDVRMREIKLPLLNEQVFVKVNIQFLLRMRYLQFNISLIKIKSKVE